MTEVGTVYGEALYTLATEEGLSAEIQKELAVLRESFQAEPDFCALLASPALAKPERCQILDESFRGKVHPYVLNFLKILTERGYLRHFHHCCDAYTNHYYQDHGILPVTAVTAAALSQAQAEKLRQKLHQLTGKQIELHCQVNPAVLGGIRLDYQGQRLDGTVAHRLDNLREHLKKTIL